MAKIKYEDIKHQAELHGWEVISKQYVNLKTEMEWHCPEGHIIHYTYKKARDTEFVCPFCETAKESKGIEVKPKSKGIKRILAIDDATQVSGWAIFDDKELVTYGKVQLTQTDPIERISRMRQWLINMIQNWNIDKIAIEDIQLQKFTNKAGGESNAVVTYKTLAQLQGVLLVTCYEMKKPCVTIFASTWRSHCKITAKQRTDQKRAAQLLVKNKFNIDATQDEADAICIGIYMVEKHNASAMIDFSTLE